ncbi:hypothetical protein D3C72_1684610 [compost metagenome]
MSASSTPRSGLPVLKTRVVTRRVFGSQVTGSKPRARQLALRFSVPLFSRSGSHGSLRPAAPRLPGLNISPRDGARTAVALVTRKRMSGIGAHEPASFQDSTLPARS